jgi:hypothetical protein
MVVFGIAGTASPQEPQFGGTFIAAFVCDDGIIIGADSRSTFMDGAGSRIGYIDGMSKVFVQQGTAFAVSGLTSLGDELFGAFVRRNDYLLARPANEVLFGVSVRLPFRNVEKVLLLSAGFVDGEAMICAKDPVHPQLCKKSGWIANRESHSLDQWNSHLTALPKAQEVVAALKEAIAESAAGDPTVGGPLAIAYLQKGEPPQWLENGTQDDNWIRICDMVSDYHHNRAQIGFTHSREELDRFLNATCPASKK